NPLNGVRRLVDRRNREETSAGRKRILDSCILDHDGTTGGEKARGPIAEPSGPAPDVQSFGTAELAGRISDVFQIRFRRRGYRLGRLTRHPFCASSPTSSSPDPLSRAISIGSPARAGKRRNRLNSSAFGPHMTP